ERGGDAGELLDGRLAAKGVRSARRTGRGEAAAGLLERTWVRQGQQRLPAVAGDKQHGLGEAERSDVPGTRKSRLPALERLRPTPPVGYSDQGQPIHGRHDRGTAGAICQGSVTGGQLRAGGRE